MVSIPRRRRGQGMTEYIIIIAVVAILSLGIVLKFGNQVRAYFVGAGQAMGQGDGEAVGMENYMDGESATRTIADDF